MNKRKLKAEILGQFSRLERLAPRIQWAIDHSRDRRRRELAIEIGNAEGLVRERPSPLGIALLKVTLDAWERRFERGRLIAK